MSIDNTIERAFRFRAKIYYCVHGVPTNEKCESCELDRASDEAFYQEETYRLENSEMI